MGEKTWFVGLYDGDDDDVCFGVWCWGSGLVGREIGLGFGESVDL